MRYLNVYSPQCWNYGHGCAVSLKNAISLLLTKHSTLLVLMPKINLQDSLTQIHIISITFFNDSRWSSNRRYTVLNMGKQTDGQTDRQTERLSVSYAQFLFSEFTERYRSVYLRYIWKTNVSYILIVSNHGR